MYENQRKYVGGNSKSKGPYTEYPLQRHSQLTLLLMKMFQEYSSNPNRKGIQLF